MIYEIEMTEAAKKDLQSIFEYIAFELQEPENAKNQMRRLESRILSLDTMPERYKSYDKEPWHSQGFRILPVDNFIVFYIPDANTKIVTIIRILYSVRDIEKQLV